jgi:hypothetical protein
VVGDISFAQLAAPYFPQEDYLLTRFGLSRAHIPRDVIPFLPPLDAPLQSSTIAVEAMKEVQEGVDVARQIKHLL